MFDVHRWLQSVGLTPVVAASVLLFSLAGLLLPRSLLLALHGLELQQRYSGWLGVGVLLGSSVLLAHAAVAIGRWASSKYRHQRELAKSRAYLHTLTKEEQATLRLFLGGPVRTRKLSVVSGVVGGLVRARILYEPTGYRNEADMTADFNVSNWAWDYLRRHPGLLEF
jgi:hypothetical protein